MEGVADPRTLVPARTSSRRVQAALEQGIKAFFGGNALVAVIVLALITIFLFREGFGFFGQNLANLRLYRAGRSRIRRYHSRAFRPDMKRSRAT